MPRSGGREAWSSTRFFLGGWAIVIPEGGRDWDEAGGLSVESGDGFDSVVMVEKAGESIYEVECEDKKRAPSCSCQIRGEIPTRLSLSRPLRRFLPAVGRQASPCPLISSPSLLHPTLFFASFSVLLVSIL